MRRSDVSKERWMLRKSVSVFYCNADEVILSEGLWNGRIFDVNDEKHSGKLARTVRLLDGSLTIGEILKEVKDKSISRFIEELKSNNLLVKVQGRPMGMPESAIDLFFGVSKDDLQKKRPVIIGGGLLGECVAQLLASVGIESMSIGTQDPDVSLIKGAEYILVSSDYPQPHLYRFINAICLKEKIKWSLGLFDGSLTFITTFIPFETACYDCFEKNLESTLPVYQAATYLKFKEMLSCSSVNQLVPKPLVDIVAGFISTEAINVMGHGTGNLSGKVLCIDLPTLTFEIDDVLKLPRCEACGKLAQAKPSRQLYTSMRQLLSMVKAGQNAGQHS